MDNDIDDLFADVAFCAVFATKRCIGQETPLVSRRPLQWCILAPEPFLVSSVTKVPSLCYAIR